MLPSVGTNSYNDFSNFNALYACLCKFLPVEIYIIFRKTKSIWFVLEIETPKFAEFFVQNIIVYDKQ
jgi:hypothetical protein